MIYAEAVLEREEIPQAQLPPVPKLLAHVWAAFVDISGSRQSGMAANPITYQEIDAYCRLTGVELIPWNIGVIKRLDDLVLRMSRKGAERQGPEHEIAEMTSMKDPKAVKALFQRLKAKRARATA